MSALSYKQRDFILSISGFVTGCLFFISFIGSYRFFLVYAAYSLLKAWKIEQKILFVFSPAFVVAFYFDVSSGPMLLHTLKNHFFVILLTFIVTDHLAKGLLKKLICAMTQGQYFVKCPSCYFDNIKLVNTCTNCSYKNGSSFPVLTGKIASSFIGDKIPDRLLHMIKISDEEQILYHKKLKLNIATFKNGTRQARKHFIISTANLTILDYYSFHIRMPETWRERDIIPLAEIASVEGMMKRLFANVRPFIVITTVQGDVYEIALSIFGKYIPEIKKITEMVRKANPQIKVLLNLTTPDWK